MSPGSLGALAHTTWLDEASKLKAPAPRIKSINIPCARCGKSAGEKCVMWRQRRSRQLYKPHAIRVRDAKLANAALDAMKPRDQSMTMANGDTVTFR